MGEAAAAPNLLWEFKIAEKKDARLTKNKNGNVIRVKLIARLVLSSLSEKPGAIILIKAGMNISIIIVIINNPISNKLKTFVAKLDDFIFPFVSSEEYEGTKAALNVPSEKSLLNVFGILKATKKASAIGPEPKYIAIKKSLM